MALASAMSLNKIYNVVIITPLAPLFGAMYNNLKVIGVMTAKEAIKYADVHTRHKNARVMFNSLPESINDLKFYLFEKADAISGTSETILLAEEYIDYVDEVSSLNIQINIFNTTTEDVGIISRILREYNYNSFEIKQI